MCFMSGSALSRLLVPCMPLFSISKKKKKKKKLARDMLKVRARSGAEGSALQCIHFKLCRHL